MKELLRKPKAFSIRAIISVFWTVCIFRKNFYALQPEVGMKNFRVRNLIERLNLGVSNLTVAKNKF